MLYANSSPFGSQIGSQPGVTNFASLPSGLALRLISAVPAELFAAKRSSRRSGDRSGQLVEYASRTSAAGRRVPESRLTSSAFLGLPQISRTVFALTTEKQ